MSLISSQFLGAQILIVIPNPHFPHNGFLHCKQFKQLILNKNDILFAEIIEDSSFVRFFFKGIDWSVNILYLVTPDVKSSWW